jgi:translation initiation factor 3 subunit C
MSAAAAKSRFFAAESESDDETTSSGSSSDSGRAPAPKPGAGAKVVAASRFQAVESDSESDEGERVVRSAKDKQFEALGTIVDAIRNQLRIHNWVVLEDGASLG